MRIARSEQLAVWKKAKDLAVNVYRTTGEGRFARDYSLRDQVRRAAVSVMSNIAEGFERYGPREFRHFVSIARGSASEVRSQIHLAKELGYLSPEEANNLSILCLDLSRM